MHHHHGPKPSSHQEQSPPVTSGNSDWTSDRKAPAAPTMSHSSAREDSVLLLKQRTSQRRRKHPPASLELSSITSLNSQSNPSLVNGHQNNASSTDHCHLSPPVRYSSAFLKNLDTSVRNSGPSHSPLGHPVFLTTASDVEIQTASAPVQSAPPNQGLSNFSNTHQSRSGLPVKPPEYSTADAFNRSLRRIDKAFQQLHVIPADIRKEWDVSPDMPLLSLASCGSSSCSGDSASIGGGIDIISESGTANDERMEPDWLSQMCCNKDTLADTAPAAESPQLRSLITAELLNMVDTDETRSAASLSLHSPPSSFLHPDLSDPVVHVGRTSRTRSSNSWGPWSPPAYMSPPPTNLAMHAGFSSSVFIVSPPISPANTYSSTDNTPQSNTWTPPSFAHNPVTGYETLIPKHMLQEAVNDASSGPGFPKTQLPKYPPLSKEPDKQLPEAIRGKVATTEGSVQTPSKLDVETIAVLSRLPLFGGIGAAPSRTGAYTRSRNATHPTIPIEKDRSGQGQNVDRASPATPCVFEPQIQQQQPPIPYLQQSNTVMSPFGGFPCSTSPVGPLSSSLPAGVSKSEHRALHFGPTSAPPISTFHTPALMPNPVPLGRMPLSPMHPRSAGPFASTFLANPAKNSGPQQNLAIPRFQRRYQAPPRPTSMSSYLTPELASIWQDNDQNMGIAPLTSTATYRDPSTDTMNPYNVGTSSSNASFHSNAPRFNSPTQPSVDPMHHMRGGYNPANTHRHQQYGSANEPGYASISNMYAYKSPSPQQQLILPGTDTSMEYSRGMQHQYTSQFPTRANTVPHPGLPDWLPELKRSVEAFLREGSAPQLVEYLSFLKTVHPMALRPYIKQLISLAVKQKARERLVSAVYLGLRSPQAYTVRDVIETLSVYEIGIQDMVNNTTIATLAYLLAVMLKDGVVSYMEVQWLTTQYHAHDSEAAKRLVSALIATLNEMLSQPEFLALTSVFNLHELFCEPSTAVIAFQLAKVLDPSIVKTVIGGGTAPAMMNQYL